jgi:hypothetical protein
MEGYWWKCEECDHEVRCESLLGCGIPTYVHDQIIEREWDQSALRQKCPTCKQFSLLITYEFPRKDREIVSVLNIVGPEDNNGDYVPMMWVTRPESSKREVWFQFNYMRGRNPFGLNKAAVFSEDGLRSLARIYEQKTGRSLF